MTYTDTAAAYARDMGYRAEMRQNLMTADADEIAAMWDDIAAAAIGDWIAENPDEYAAIDSVMTLKTGRGLRYYVTTITD